MGKVLGFPNFLNTIVSYLKNEATDQRTYTLPDRDLDLDNVNKVTIVSKIDDYTLLAADLTNILAGKFLIFEMNKATANTLTIPDNATLAIPIGTIIGVRRIGAGTTTLAGSGATSITGSSGGLSDAGLNVLMIVEKTGTNTWTLQNGTTGVGWTSWVPTVTGFSGTPTTSGQHTRLPNNVAIVRFVVSGSSNATTFTITNLPYTAKSGAHHIVWGNDNAVGQAITCQHTASSGTLTFTKFGAAFTSSGNKAAFATITYEIE